jgi:hypothetical protein
MATGKLRWPRAGPQDIRYPDHCGRERTGPHGTSIASLAPGPWTSCSEPGQDRRRDQLVKVFRPQRCATSR